jgi:hypothetical protein
MTTEAHLKLELSKAQSEIQRLRDRLATAFPHSPQGPIFGLPCPQMFWHVISHLTRYILLQYRRLSQDRALDRGRPSAGKSFKTRRG